MRLLSVLASLVCSSLALGAPVNNVCPVSGNPVNADATTVAYEGWDIGFCCAMCPSKWESMRTASKVEFLEKHVPAAPINAECPIGKEPIDLGTPVFMYKGNAIGTCCPGCSEPFMEWSEADRDAYVEKHLAATRVNDVCPIGGDPIEDEHGPSVVFMSKRIAFCCEGCHQRWNIMTQQARLQVLAKATGEANSEE